MQETVPANFTCHDQMWRGGKSWSLGETVSALVLIVSLASAIIFDGWLVTQSLQTVCQVALFFAVMTLITGYELSNRDIWSFSFVYLFILGLFHFGLTGSFALGLVSSDHIIHAAYWWLLPTTPAAILTITKGYLACGLGIALGRMLHHRRSPRAAQAASSDPGPQLVLICGFILVMSSVSYWFYSVYSAGGVAAFAGSYGAYLSATTGGLMPWVWMGMGIGVCFLAASPPTRLRSIAFGAFVVFTVVALPMGLRGEVMFTAAAALVILAKHRRMPSAKTALLGVFVILILISLIREVRQVGISGAWDGDFSPGITSGLVELGSTIRPVTLVVYWHEQGDPFINGASYWAPLDRAICRVIHPWECTPAGDDERLSNVLIANRAGPYGFSPIAEAYRNFGTSGVILVMLLIGGLISLMGSWATDWKKQAFASIVLVELLINVRNSFTPVPAHLVFGGVIVLALVLVSRYTTKRLGDYLVSHGS